MVLVSGVNQLKFQSSVLTFSNDLYILFFSWTTVGSIQQCRAGAGLAFSECSASLLLNSQLNNQEREQGY